MARPIRLVRLVVAALAVAATLSLAGCGRASVACSDSDAVSLITQTAGAQFLYRQRYSDPRLETKVVELAEERLSLEDIATTRGASAERPVAECEATLAVEMYDVGRDYEKLKARPQGATSSEMQDRLEVFERDPSNLIRLGDRRRVTMNVSYTVGRTDDGRTTIRFQNP